MIKGTHSVPFFDVVRCDNKIDVCNMVKRNYIIVERVDRINKNDKKRG